MQSYVYTRLSSSQCVYLRTCVCVHVINPGPGQGHILPTCFFFFSSKPNNIQIIQPALQYVVKYILNPLHIPMLSRTTNAAAKASTNM